MLFTDPISFVVHETFVFLCNPMEQLPGRCSFRDQSFILFIGRDTDLASIHSRVSQRLDVNMQENMLKYRLPMDTDVEQVLLDDGDVQAMFDLHKCQGTSFINLQIHAVETRCLSTHASRQSEVLQTCMAVLWKPQNPSNYQEEVWSCTIEDKGRKNDSVRLTVRCNVSVCPWRLHASVVREGPQFAIKSLNNIHTCGCDIMSDGHPRTSKKWVANAVMGKLVDKPTYRASEMMSDIHREYGMVGQRGCCQFSIRTSYHMLNWYSERALQSNLGSILSLEVDPETQRFKHFFICFQESTYGFEVGC
ncbi:hypothetical protein Taro_017342 [Colocasia esculenta]|uniref:Transposase MuDR plant domain-containing protein n=1 Tax=Colocasia esculenta TaxID=4460 RepID=A0A843UZ27_COLES|nr:hypothetical protein [Colocasia esculenta]